MHVYSPAPADARKIADAKLWSINGLGLEGWLPRLVQASGSKAPIIAASNGVAPIKAGSSADPHAWQSVANAKIYVTNIRDALVAADPAGAEVFRRQAAAYLAKLDALDRELRDAVGANSAGAPQGDLDPRCIRLFCQGAYGIEFIAPAGRIDRIRAQRPRYRRHHHPDQRHRKFRRFSSKISAMPG